MLRSPPTTGLPLSLRPTSYHPPTKHLYGHTDGFAQERLLHDVGAQVPGEIALLTASVGAEGALERLLPSVGAHVLGETALHTASVGADGALERLLPSVGAHVPGELALVTASVGADGAL